MSKNKSIKPLIGTISAALLTSAVTMPVHASENPFAAQELSSGFELASDHAEGKCGEGKCGEGKCGSSEKEGEGKCGEGKCGGEGKDGEGKCGEGKCGEGKCGA